ncbi:hypothetical protein [Methanimicrococcus hongohii]|uniref:hypothetical protein n=1 Tax=Methanimicrococcus hongohii TaxID=3028295 RepID=UPI00292F4392|nr:hypothetical protein [Methanimicrococcus sp. Hf6]
MADSSPHKTKIQKPLCLRFCFSVSSCSFLQLSFTVTAQAEPANLQLSFAASAPAKRNSLQLSFILQLPPRELLHFYLVFQTRPLSFIIFLNEAQTSYF